MMQLIRKWTIRVRKEFQDGFEVAGETKFVLFKDQTIPIIEMDIKDLRDLKEFFAGYKDPYGIDNPDHVSKLK